MHASQFQSWLEELGVQFKRLSNLERNQTLDHLIEYCEATQLYYLHNKLNPLLKRDFLTQLPPEISCQILQYLDPVTLVICRQVCTAWRQTVDACDVAWMQACLKLGASQGVLHTLGKTDFKDLYFYLVKRLSTLRQGVAFETSFLCGHTERVNALYYRDGKLATGSDDRTVRVWDCETQRCLTVLDTHTVSAVMFDNDFVVTASYDTTAAKWCMTTGIRLLSYHGHVAAVFALDYNRELDILVTASADVSIKVWSLSAGHVLTTLFTDASWPTSVSVHKMEKQPSVYYVMGADSSKAVTWRINQSNHSVENMLEKADVSEQNGILYHTVQDSQAYYLTTLCDKGAGPAWEIPYCINTSTIDSCGERKTVCKANCDNFIRACLGIGRQFHVLLKDHGLLICLEIYNHATKQVVASMELPCKPAASQKNTTHTLGDTSWLDGFDSENDRGVFFAVSLTDHTILLMNWLQLNSR